MKNFISFVLVFLYFFMPSLKILGYPINTHFYYLLLLSGFAVLIGKIPKRIVLIVAVTLLPFLYSLLIFSMVGSLDTAYLNDFLYTLLNIVAAIFIGRYIALNYQANTTQIVKLVYFVGLIHALIMIASFFITPFKEFLYSFVYLGDKGSLFVELSQRAPGLTSSGGDSLAIFQSISMVFGVFYYLLNKNLSYKFKLLYFISLPIFTLSILLTARTGFVVLIAGLLFAFSYSFFVIVNRSNLFIRINSHLFMLAFAVSIFLIVIGHFFIDSDYSRFINRAFEFYFNYLNDGEIYTTSTNHLSTMYFLPESIDSVLFGTGNYGRDLALGIIDSDVGYVRVIFGSGLVGVLLTFGGLFLIWILHRDVLKKSGLNIYYLLVLMVLFIVNLKVLHVYGNSYLFKVLILLLVVTFYSSYIGNRANNKVTFSNNAKV